MRKEVPEIGWGDFAILATGNPGVLALRYDWRNNAVVFVHNFMETPCETRFAVGLADGTEKLLVNLLGEQHSRAQDDGKHHLVLEPYGYRWYRVGGLDYLLKRTDIDQ